MDRKDMVIEEMGDELNEIKKKNKEIGRNLAEQERYIKQIKQKMK